MQACQGTMDRTAISSPELVYTPTDSLGTLIGTDAKKAESGRDDLNSIHLELKYPNTNVTVLMSTLFGQTSHRHHFIPAIAEEIRNSDGSDLCMICLLMLQAK